MKASNLLLIGGAVLSFLLSGSASALSLSFSNEPGSFVHFGGGGLTFQDEDPGSFNDIRITATNGVGDAVGLTGDIDGDFAIGMVSSPGLGQQTATLTGSGHLAIFDGDSSVLTGDISFVSITTFFNFGFFDMGAAINLTNLRYEGTNADLLALAAGGSGILQTSFTAPIMTSLSSLIDGQSQVSNYSGSIVGAAPSPQRLPDSVSPVPEPSAALCFALGALVIATVRRHKS